MSNKKLSQNDLRKVMQDHKKKLGVTKKVDSPLAKYNDLGQLMCIICKSTIKNETVWIVHLNSKGHKDNVALAKQALAKQDSSAPKTDSSLKRPSSVILSEEPKKKIKGILKNSGNSSNPDQTSALPVDFFDKPGTKDVKTVDKSEMKAESDKNEVDAGATSLPEGFFDDPILDAKVRNVEYKDPVEEEWDKFLKEIKEETAQSAQIIAEDHEEATIERQFDEIDEQFGHWSRVMNLVKCKEQIRPVQKQSEAMSEDESSGNESDFDEFFDWRAKNYDKKVELSR